ncbi:phosphoesterase [Halomicrococcus gelatinilyticus]|uniref:phosphoesterase n=1 Tax=Halomicrococcus gelatinilyticus TaxID=1702103 RepID=UPI002E11D587
MGVFSQAMQWYPYVVHPITVLGVGILVLIRYEWGRQAVDSSAFWHRIGGFLVAGAFALLPTVVYFLTRDVSVVAATKGNAWEVDALVAGGVFLAAVVNWVLWRHYRWGRLVPDAMQALAAVTVPYALLSPFWNVSGHVTIALMPTLYLTLLDRRFWPTLLLPVVMVPNRVFLNAHTWAQSVGAFVVTAAVVVGVHRLQTGEEHA